MREVAVIGIGITKFGELWDKSLRHLGLEAGYQAILDAGITSDDIDALYIGNMSSGSAIAQEHIAPLFADEVGLTRGHIPATGIEAASASGGLAFRQGYLAVAAGQHELVVVGGAEKMSDANPAELIETLTSGADREWEGFFGATLPSLWAMMARRHMYEYGTTQEQLAQVIVKNHKNAKFNPMAQYQSELKLEVVLNAPRVAEPLGVFDCAPTSDGAAAVVLCSMEKAKALCEQPIKIIGSGQASDTMALHDRQSLTKIDSTKFAVKRAFKHAGKSIKDINVAEVHDAYSISEILAIEDLGIVEKGAGGKAVEDGLTALDGEFPINTSGGLKARGHPAGATGVAQIVEIVIQLRGAAGERQVKAAKYGLTHNLGGTGGTAVVQIFEGGV
ncbi:MAG: thiolase domain-containing protein [Thermoplasmata archaeon]|nr:thiolase domain-containing protein [Thermoplasmata archaeon]